MKRQLKAWGSEQEMLKDLNTAVEEVIPTPKLPYEASSYEKALFEKIVEP